MYAMSTIFNLGPGMRETADRMCEAWAPVLSSLKGFKSATFFGDAEIGEYGALSLWETQEDAEAALAATKAKFQEQVASIAKKPPVRKVYEG